MQPSSDLEDRIPIDSVCILLRSSNEVTVKHALEYVLLMSVEVDECKKICSSPAVINEILNVSYKHKDDDIGKLALNAIINISGDEIGASVLYDCKIGNEKAIIRFFNYVTEKNSKLAEHACKILANMTISEELVSKIVKDILNHKEMFRTTFQAIYNKNYNVMGCYVCDYLSQCFGNLAQSLEFQRYLLTIENGNLFCSILPIIYCGDTVLQKRGIASTVYNCLFNSENHPVLLNKPFDILPFLLLPLAGPEEFDDEDVEKMPIELQYLEVSKEREKDPEIRTLILKSLLMLCATTYGREFLRDKQSYLILREYHKWEKDSNILLACENVVDILIRTEEEIGVDNLKSLTVPDDLIDKFKKMDSLYIDSSL